MVCGSAVRCCGRSRALLLLLLLLLMQSVAASIEAEVIYVFGVPTSDLAGLKTRKMLECDCSEARCKPAGSSMPLSSDTHACIVIYIRIRICTWVPCMVRWSHMPLWQERHASVKA